MRKRKRCFTLVELLVVIAILAVLATVSILGYAAFTKKANISNDQAVVSQMNIALKSNEALGDKARYCHQAVQQCIDAGFILENLTPSTAKYNFAYDQANNRFMLLDENYEFNYGEDNHSTDRYYIHVVVGSDAELTQANNNEYSTYLRVNFEYKDKTKAITTNKGIDVGDNYDVSLIYYNNINDNPISQDVVIRTNSFETILTVKAYDNGAQCDKVTHYGFAAIVNADKVGHASYHENGTIGRLKVTDGKAVVEAGALVVCPMDIDGSATTAVIEVKEGATVLPDGEYTKQENNVANEFVPDCGAGHHDFGEKIVVDSLHIYEVCRCCGYTLITVQDNEGHEVKQSKNTINNEGVVTSEVVTPIETYLIALQVNETPAASKIKNYEITGEPVIETPKVEKQEEQSACDHDYNNGVITLQPTCSTTGVKTYTCSKCGDTYALKVATTPHKYYDDEEYPQGAVFDHTEKCIVCGALRKDNNGNVIVCMIGDKAYDTLEHAIADVPTDGTLTKIIMVNNDAAIIKNYANFGWCAWKIKTGQNVVIDLAGYILKDLVDFGNETAGSNGAFSIQAGATLTIMDSSCKESSYDGTGMVYNEIANGTPMSYWPSENRSDDVILNCGKFILESGTLQVKLVGVISYCIDNLSGASCIVNGGKLYLEFEKYSGQNVIRLFQDNTSCTINGGYLRCKGSIIHCQECTDKTKQTVNVTGGTFIGGDMYEFIYNYNSKYTVSITGGTFKYDHIPEGVVGILIYYEPYGEFDCNTGNYYGSCIPQSYINYASYQKYFLNWVGGDTIVQSDEDFYIHKDGTYYKFASSELTYHGDTDHSHYITKYDKQYCYKMLASEHDNYEENIPIADGYEFVKNGDLTVTIVKSN